MPFMPINAHKRLFLMFKNALFWYDTFWCSKMHFSARKRNQKRVKNSPKILDNAEDVHCIYTTFRLQCHVFFIVMMQREY